MGADAHAHVPALDRAPQLRESISPTCSKAKKPASRRSPSKSLGRVPTATSSPSAASTGLVRISPFDSSARRHTSFALVEALPVLDDDIEIKSSRKMSRWTCTGRAGRAASTCRRTPPPSALTHIPIGDRRDLPERTQPTPEPRVGDESAAREAVRYRASERSKKKQARLRGKHVEAGWGNQIRSYVLQPYQMVKDLRTDVEIGNTGAVLDGEIDPFIEAWLKDKQVRADHPW